MHSKIDVVSRVMDVFDPANSRGTTLARLGYDVIGSISLEGCTRHFS